MSEQKAPITQEQFDDLLGKLNVLQASHDELASRPTGTSDAPKPKRVEKHTATVLLWDGKPVVNFDNVKTQEVEDPKTKEIILVSSNKINISYKDEGKVVTKEVNYRSLMENSVRALVEIEKMDKQDVVIPQGSLLKKIWTTAADPKSLRETGKAFTPELVELLQTVQKIVATVRFVDGEYAGKTLTLDANSLNR